MSLPSPESSQQARLRFAAEARLKAGTAPPTNGWPTGVTALGLLHGLASSPQSADDALKLLHELQVHQVEFDLQHEQMEATQRQVAEDLARYQALYDFAPVPYLIVAHDGDILEGNVAAAGLFEVAQDELRGHRILDFLAPESQWALNALLKRLRAGSAVETCEVRPSSAHSARPFRLMASSAPDGGSFLLVVLVDTSGLARPDPSV
jgi:PAS domain S-box-containing protein